MLSHFICHKNVDSLDMLSNISKKQTISGNAIFTYRTQDVLGTDMSQWYAVRDTGGTQPFDYI